MKLVDVMLISTSASSHHNHIDIVLQISHDNVPCLEKKIFEKKKNKFEKKKKTPAGLKLHLDTWVTRQQHGQGGFGRRLLLNFIFEKKSENLKCSLIQKTSL